MGFFDDIFGQPFGGMFDMNGDGNINSTDALAVLKITVGIGNSSELSKADIVKLYNDGLISAEDLKNCKQQTPYSCEFERLANIV